MEDIRYDVAIIGGGVSGCACAWNCAINGLKTIVIEKKSYLGGAISGGLVIPVMKTDGQNINNEFYKELIKNAQVADAQITYSDLNKGWFNPELIKIVLEDMLISAGVKIFYNSDIFKMSTSNSLKDALSYNNKTVAQTYNDKQIKELIIKRNILSYYDETTYNDKNQVREPQKFKKLFKKISAKYFVDASGDAIISELLDLPMQKDNNQVQAETLRFIMANVDSKAFSEWLLDVDPDRNVTSVTTTMDKEYYMTTAYTNEHGKKWGLKDIFHTAIANGDLEESDAEYFQIFGVPKMPGAVAFNCPRVTSDRPYEEKLINARKSILRIANFCKLYFKGFENAYIAKISDELGVRVSNRPLAVYNFTAEDIISGKTFKNVALHSNYPIDIHSNEKNKSVLVKNKGYDFPLESLMSAAFSNLFNIGKAVGADFRAQASLRVQKSCFSMGEAVAKHIKSIIK